MNTGKEPSGDPQKYLVFVNPVGGEGKAVHVYRSQIQPLFELAEAKCDVIITGNYNQQKMMKCCYYIIIQNMLVMLNHW